MKVSEKKYQRHLGQRYLLNWVGKDVWFGGCISESFELFLTGLLTNKIIAEGRSQQVFLFFFFFALHF